MQGNPYAHLTATEWKSMKGQVIRKGENRVSPLHSCQLRQFLNQEPLPLRQRVGQHLVVPSHFPDYL